jgi:hypothetical protein
MQAFLHLKQFPLQKLFLLVAKVRIEMTRMCRLPSSFVRVLVNTIGQPRDAIVTLILLLIVAGA